jgi:flavodoxin
MTRCLVVYYSLSGNTRKVAKAVADRMGAELEAIVELRPRTGPFVRFWCAFDSIFRRMPPIAPAKRDVRDYDIVILGSPVWAGDMAAPMRTFLAREKGRIAKAAFFCTYWGAGGETALERMGEASGAEPLSIMLLAEEELERPDWRSGVERFIQQIGSAMSASDRPAEDVSQPGQTPLRLPSGTGPPHPGQSSRRP